MQDNRFAKRQARQQRQQQRAGGLHGGQAIEGASTRTLGAQFSWPTVESDGTAWQVVGQGGTVR